MLAMIIITRMTNSQTIVAAARSTGTRPRRRRMR
jgi:hypothetical protein